MQGQKLSLKDGFNPISISFWCLAKERFISISKISNAIKPTTHWQETFKAINSFYLVWYNDNRKITDLRIVSHLFFMHDDCAQNTKISR